MLVAMATGTGKTVTLVNEVYRLMKSGVGRRILFLVDRRALAAQAVRTFASFESASRRPLSSICASSTDAAMAHRRAVRLEVSVHPLPVAQT